MVFNNNNKGFVSMSIIALIVALLGGTALYTTSDINTNIQTQQIISIENMSKLLEDFYNSHNFSVSYNTYNSFNQTFLNQTYINNEYYTTNNYNINNTMLEDMSNKLSLMWDKILNTENERVNLNKTIYNLSNCNEIDFMFKDSFVNSIYDNKGLNISSSLGIVENTNFVSSFFVDSNNNVIENNIDIDYNYLYNSKHSIKTDSSKLLTITTKTNLTLNNGEIIFNMAVNDLWEWDNVEVFMLYKNNSPLLQAYLYHNRLYLKNMKNNEINYIDVGNLNVDDNEFKVYKLEFYNNEIKLVDENNNDLIILNSNPFNSLVSGIKFKSQPNRNKFYFRAIYFNQDRIIKISDKYLIGDDEYEFNKQNWNNARIYKMSDSMLYIINSKAVTLNVNNINDYSLLINTSKTSISNLYCRN